MVFKLNVLGILLIVAATSLAEQATTVAVANSSQAIRSDFMTGKCSHCKEFIKYARTELESKKKRIKELEDIAVGIRKIAPYNKIEQQLNEVKNNLSAAETRLVTLNYTIAHLNLANILKQREIDEFKRNSEKADKEYANQKSNLQDNLLQCEQKMKMLDSQQSVVIDLAENLKDMGKELAVNIKVCEKANGNIERNASSLTSSLLNNMFSLFESYVTKGHNSLLGGISVNEVYESNDSGPKWLVVLRRLNELDDFNRPWQQYVEGFGDQRNGFWYGLERLYQLTSNKRHELLIEVVGRNNVKHYIIYNNFKVGSAASKYKLESVGHRDGTIDDFMQAQVGQPFSTSDRINSPRGSCPKNYRSGWWYANCDHSDLTGGKLNCRSGGRPGCLLWRHLDTSAYPVKQLQMMIRSFDLDE